MSKPDDIPQDVLLAAAQVVVMLPPQADEATTGDAIDRIARAILAERERCAKLADQQAMDEHELQQATDYGQGVHHAASYLATEIRKGTTP